MATRTQQAHKKKAVLLALEKSLGIVTTACKAADVARRTFYKWMDADPEFAAQVRDMDEVALDFAESQLHKNIKAGREASTIFYLKTKGKNRGYIERRELTMTDQPAFVIKPEQKAAIKMLDVIHKKTGTEDEK